MVFYHGTSAENWKQIQKEGVLWGRRYIVDDKNIPLREVSRCTYLAVDSEEAKQYGDIVLRVEYDPFMHKKKNNYMDGCWQIRVYEPISISQLDTFNP